MKKYTIIYKKGKDFIKYETDTLFTIEMINVFDFTELLIINNYNGNKIDFNYQDRNTILIYEYLKIENELICCDSYIENRNF